MSHAAAPQTSAGAAVAHQVEPLHEGIAVLTAVLLDSVQLALAPGASNPASQAPAAQQKLSALSF